jgi:DNA-binding response OmpR family regulator
VLLVDRSPESREILRLLLERRGATTIEAEHPEDALRIADDFRPDLIVLDAESDVTPTGEPTNDLREAAHLNDTPIVILGTLRHSRGLPAGQIMPKPYHYGPLIRTIDGLLAAS